MMYAGGFGVKQDFNRTVEYLIQSMKAMNLTLVFF